MSCLQRQRFKRKAIYYKTNDTDVESFDGFVALSTVRMGAWSIRNEVGARFIMSLARIRPFALSCGPHFPYRRARLPYQAMRRSARKRRRR